MISILQLIMLVVILAVVVFTGRCVSGLDKMNGHVMADIASLRKSTEKLIKINYARRKKDESDSDIVERRNAGDNRN